MEKSNELKRLERADDKAHKKKSREPLYEWGMQLEKQLEDKIRKFYEEKFKKHTLLRGLHRGDHCRDYDDHELV